MADLLTNSLQHELNGLIWSSTGATRGAFRAALNALHVADVARGEWAPEPGHRAGACEIVEAIHGKDLPAKMLTDEQVDSATVEESKVDNSFLRLRAGGREWIIEVEHDSDGEGGTKEFYLVRAVGYVEVSR